MTRHYTLHEFRKQLGQLESRHPGARMPWLHDAMSEEDLDLELGQICAMIDAMTDSERDNPSLISGFRMTEIAHTCGLKALEVEKFIVQFMQIQSIMDRIAGFDS